MSNIEYRTENGTNYALVPVEIYERLTAVSEDMADLEAIHDHRKSQPQMIPGTLLERLFQGENPIRLWREYRKKTQTGLAGELGLSRGYLNQLENGKRTMSIATLRKLAEALDTDMEFLVASPLK